MRPLLLLLATMMLPGCATPSLRAAEHALGRGRVVPAHARVDGSGAVIRVARRGFLGGEVRTDEWYGFGVATARLRCDVPGGAVCAFFFYQTGVGDAADEVDIEILGATRQVMFTTWVAGRRTHQLRRTLAFDPAAGVHEYAIERRPGRVAFRIDGEELAAFEGPGLPTAVMPLMVNAWWAAWLEPDGGAEGTLHLESMEWTP